jgi:hypothetical protein
MIKSLSIRHFIGIKHKNVLQKLSKSVLLLLYAVIPIIEDNKM